MSVAQDLYEGGWITYMRTDSVTLSDTAIAAARAQVLALYGPSYLPAKPRVYASKVKNAQEAHEAIRPAGEVFQTPAETGLNGDQRRLYELVWMRTVASQMNDATGESMSVQIAATHGARSPFSSARSPSARSRHPAGRSRSRASSRRTSRRTTTPTRPATTPRRGCRSCTAGTGLDVLEVVPAGHETRPPARYTEPSLVAKLEELEIGRPSTYATILRTITSRDYVFKKGSAPCTDLARLRRDPAARGALRPPRRLRVHRRHGADARRDRQRRGRAQGRAERLLLRRRWRRGRGLREESVTELGDIDARALSSFPVPRRPRHHDPRRPLRHVHRDRRRAPRQRARGPSA